MERVYIKSDNLVSMVESLCKLDVVDFDDVEFNKQLAAIQEYIGQDDGGYAGIFFDDYIEEEWPTTSFKYRVDTLKRYIQNELDYILDRE